jgi:hypothetical protein
MNITAKHNDAVYTETPSSRTRTNTSDLRNSYVVQQIRAASVVKSQNSGRD